MGKLQPHVSGLLLLLIMTLKADDFRSTIIVNCVLNAFLSYTATALNSVTLLALRKSSTTLPKPLRTLLLSLAVSDLGVGLLVQPLYILSLVMVFQGNTETQIIDITSKVSIITTTVFGYASFFGVAALAADRFLTVHLHLRYQELVTRKRVFAVVISVWMFSAILSMTTAVFKSTRCIVVSITGIVVESVCYVAAALFYIKIYFAVRYLWKQNKTLQVQLTQTRVQNIANTAKLRKCVVGPFYAYLVFLACHLPSSCVRIILERNGLKTVTWQLIKYTHTLVYLNSSLNPLIYSWKMRHIRRAIIDMLRNISPKKPAVYLS